MKKAVAFIIAFMYLGLTSGLAVNISYCMGKVSRVQVDSYSTAACKCSSKQQMPCCNHQFHLLKVNDAHQLADADFSFKTPVLTLHTFDNLVSKLSQSQFSKVPESVLLPPLLSPPDINVFLCTYRI